MTFASADGVPEPASSRLEPAVARAAHRAGALGGGMLWTGIALVLVGWQTSVASLTVVADAGFGMPELAATRPSLVALLLAWAGTPAGLGMIALAVLGLVLGVAGTFVSVRVLRRGGAPRPTATTMLGAGLGALVGTAAAAAIDGIAPIGWRLAFGTYGGGDAASTAEAATRILPQMIGGVASGYAILAVACTAAGVLTWRLAARLLAPRA